MSIALGSAPDSWGVWFADDPKQTPWERFLDEVAEAGYSRTELGPYGYLPTDAGQLARVLDARNLSLTAAVTVFDLELPSALAAVESELRASCLLVQELGGSFLVFIDDFTTELFTGVARRPALLGDDEWRTLIETSLRVVEIADEYNLRAVMHPHAGSHLQYEAEIERFLADTPSDIGLCLDVGHHAYCGGDPVSFFRTHAARVPYLHLKSVDTEKREQVTHDDLRFDEAVEQGVFVEPAVGVVDFVELKRALDDVDFDGVGTVEQDMYPTSFGTPLPIARRTFESLRALGYGS